jgi:dCTP deaminase
MYLNDLKLKDLCENQNDSLASIPAEFSALIRTEEFDRYQPSSVELHLHPVVKIQQTDGTFKEHDLRDGDLKIKRGDCLEASTIEYVRMPANLLARVEGKSTLARKFLVIHHTGGFIDPGFKGQITLELCLNGKAPVVLKAGMKIAQLAVAECYMCAWPYGHERRKSKYQNQEGPTSARPEPEDE